MLTTRNNTNNHIFHPLPKRLYIYKINKNRRRTIQNKKSTHKRKLQRIQLEMKITLTNKIKGTISGILFYIILWLSFYIGKKINEEMWYFIPYITTAISFVLLFFYLCFYYYLDKDC